MKAAEPDRLQSAIAEVYGGTLEDFVRRRNALAKELRAAGERDSATKVKGLKKPSRIAWALNLGVLGDRGAIDSLSAAVAEVLDAQNAGGDVRGAIAGLRTAVRELAGEAARAAEAAGHRMEPGALANALLAVLGRPEHFDQLRDGYLTEIPDAGGLDVLAALSSAPIPAAVPTAHEAAADLSSPAQVGAAARTAARQAARHLAEARTRSEAARRAVDNAESRLQSARERLRHAGEEVRAAQNLVDRARRESDKAAAQLVEAESAAAEAERRLTEGSPARS